MNTFHVEQPLANGALWDAVEGSEASTLDEARATMGALEIDRGLRGLRIVMVERQKPGGMGYSEVIEYGAPADPLDF